MANYVKFMRGTTAAYDKLTNKDDDTLYFLSDNNGQEGALYLGTKLIAGPDVISGANSLGELTDVILTPNLDYDALLMYDSIEMKWQDYSFDALTFRAANEVLEGAAGFVPAPQVDDVYKFLRGDGTWATVGAECQIFDSIQTKVNQSHANALEQNTAGFILNKGDLAIIQDFIIDGKYQYTSYVYNGEKWCALDKEYDAENVYLKSDFTLDNDVNITIPSAGKNVVEAFQLILSHIETAVLTDLKTITFDGRTLGLKDFGKRFYKYIAASGDESEGTYQQAYYILQEVDQNNPWKSGLEPKVVNENGNLVLGWYEPNPTTVDGLNNLINAIQEEVDTLTTATANINLRLNDTYTKEETNAQIAAAAHLKRKKVNSINDIDTSAADADQYIYMVPTENGEDNNKYNEYMVIDGVIESVGTWEVDLSDYITKEEFNTSNVTINNSINTLDQKVKEIEVNAEKNYINSVSDSFNVDNNRNLILISVPSSIDLSSNISLINTFVKKDNDKDLVLKTEIQKLFTVKENAEQNIINSVNENEFSITEDIERKLSIKQIEGNKIVNLKNNSEFAEVITDIQTINDNLGNVQSEVSTIKSQLTTINVSLTTMNTNISNIDNRLTVVENAITWQEL